MTKEEIDKVIDEAESKTYSTVISIDNLDFYLERINDETFYISGPGKSKILLKQKIECDTWYEAQKEAKEILKEFYYLFEKELIKRK